MRGRTLGRRDAARLVVLPSLAEAEVPSVTRPKMRGECINGERPCPWVSCRHHLALSINQYGGVRIELPDENGELDLEKFEHTCSLDVADAGDHTLDEVGALMDVSRERVRQIEDIALAYAEREMERYR